MALTSLACVEDYRQPMIVGAATHPLNAVPVTALAIIFLMMGALVGCLGLLFVDLVALVAVVRWPRARDGLRRRADRRARLRAAERLAPADQAEWRSLEAVAQRTSPFNPRRAEVEALLDSFVNIALALAYARQCADGGDVNLPRRSDGHLATLVERRAAAGRRAERAMQAMREQLETTEQLVRLTCDVAIAEECEAGAELWLSDGEHDRDDDELAQVRFPRIGSQLD